MNMKNSILPLALLLGLAGCFDDSGSSVPSTAVVATSTSTASRLESWASSATLSLPNDSNLATANLYQRWDSVVSLGKYQAQARENIKAIARDWASRNSTVSQWTELKSFAGIDSIGFHGNLSFVRFSVDGITQGGYVWMPTKARTQPVPVVLFGHPGDNGLSKSFMNLLLNYLLDTTYTNQVAIVAPAYRGESATAGLDSINSPSSARSPWDRDVDDALAMLTEVLRRNPSQLDAQRIAAIGYSRGAGVSLLAGLRDSRIKAIFEIAGPTDFFAPSIQRISMQLIRRESISLPGLNELDAQLLQPFSNGTISADSLRHALLQRSAARLALSGLLPSATALHGTLDSTVFPDQSAALKLADPRVNYASIAGMDHSSFFSSASEFANVQSQLQSFLQTQLSLGK